MTTFSATLSKAVAHLFIAVTLVFTPLISSAKSKDKSNDPPPYSEGCKSSEAKC